MKFLVFYDGTCPFCVYSANRLKKMDWLNRLEIMDLYSPGILEKHEISMEEAIKRIQVVNKKFERKEGMQALLEISFQLPLLWFFIPFFWISIQFGLGTKIYDWIARKRFLFPVPGYCPFPEE
jgi:predicted DCC family thiol-disulfide oxidoreductase YuxK